MTTTVKVDQWEKGGLCGDVAFCFGGCKFIGCVVVRVDICLVVFAVVQLHNLSRDGRFEGAIVIWIID